MEGPRLGAKLELQLPAYSTATATEDLSHVCKPTPQLKAVLDPPPTKRGQGLNPCPHGYQLGSLLLSHKRMPTDPFLIREATTQSLIIQSMGEMAVTHIPLFVCWWEHDCAATLWVI